MSGRKCHFAMKITVCTNMITDKGSKCKFFFQCLKVDEAELEERTRAFKSRMKKIGKQPLEEKVIMI